MSDFSKKFFRVSEILERYEEGRLAVHDVRVKYPKRFIKYCISRNPTPSLLFDGSVREWKIIDGSKRIRTWIDFINNKFSLEDGRFFNDLTYERHWLKDYMVESHFLLPGTQNREQIIKCIKEEDYEF